MKMKMKITVSEDATIIVFIIGKQNLMFAYLHILLENNLVIFWSE